MDGTWRTVLGPDGTPVVPDDAPPARVARGPVLPERYVDLGHFATGGIGEVRRVRDTKLDTELVMKLQRRGAGETLRRRFEREARLTARLHHPNIVPALDLGTLANGTPWFTMPEVRGKTLREVMDGVDVPLRRLVELVEGVARALAYAHSEGVVHRDVKPQNLMLGRFGDVRIMDFGVALDLRAPDRDLDDAVVGTPLYMAPEQARGEVASCNAAIDVYALGVLLYEIVTGSLPYEGGGIQVWHQIIEGPPPDPAERVVEGREAPPALLQLVRDAMRRDPAGRPDALALADRLRSWLDGEERRQRALQILREAEPLAAEVGVLRARAAALDERARAMLAPLPTYAPLEDKEPAWALEAEARAVLLDVMRRETRYLQQLQAALEQDPDCDEAHRRLATHHRRSLEQAEAVHDEEQELVHEEGLRAHDRGEHAAYLSGVAAVTLITDPPGATVIAERLVHRSMRWQVAEAVALGTTPLHAAPLPHGNWRLVVRSPGRRDVIYPVRVRRSEHWDGVPPDGTEPFPIALPADLDDGEVYVPAGWFPAGGDPDAIDGLLAGRVWVDGFCIQRFPVTMGEWARFVDAHGPDAEPWVPREMNGVERARWAWRGGRWERPSTDLDDIPVFLVSGLAARDYAGWLSERTGRAWRLPHELEWEKAARGVDGRIYPWGDGFDPALAHVISSMQGVPAVGPNELFPTDVSPYGVRGQGGNIREFCDTRWHRPSRPPETLVFERPNATDLWVIRGGIFSAMAHLSRATNRLAQRGDRTMQEVSFRLVRPLS
ncbi:MAG: SUMF1/EgtB/PvdO family nonheme iron enzyme [Alphaproteobacteria bacterium]|nr:SUMF1/EgtB/PvdO family nonheme iron enzyme [Alphaproteobacteria bacterium]